MQLADYSSHAKTNLHLHYIPNYSARHQKNRSEIVLAPFSTGPRFCVLSYTVTPGWWNHPRPRAEREKWVRKDAPPDYGVTVRAFVRPIRLNQSRVARARGAAGLVSGGLYLR